MRIMEQYHHINVSKASQTEEHPKTINKSKWEGQIKREAEDKTKPKHWKKQRAITTTRWTEYILTRLTRKESQAMLRVRTSMLNVRMNHKNES